MRKLKVYLRENPSAPVLVGILAETSEKRCFFEYDSTFLEKGINISPFKLRLAGGLQENHDSFPPQIHGVFNDSIPDGWGLLLMDRFFRVHGRNIRDITAIDRLSYIGENGMGALAYEPAEDTGRSKDPPLNLYRLAKNSMEILQGRTEEVLPEMAKAGGSPGGARPKILVGFNGRELISGEGSLPGGFDPWLIKFKAENDFQDAGKIEYVYSVMAEKAGLDVPEHRLFNDSRGNSYFGTRRFDREDNRRIHVHTLGNMIHADFRLPSLDYEILLKVCYRLTGNMADVKKCFRLMVFNVLSYNRDDHGRNFAFKMDLNGRWSFAPPYDLMFSYGPGGEHSTSVAGEGRCPGARDFKRLAELAGIAGMESEGIIGEVRESVRQWTSLARAARVSGETIRLVADCQTKIE
ncbi:MAG: type II toxin-antitoxin system HipA family toxin [Victivallales bacterium]